VIDWSTAILDKWALGSGQTGITRLYSLVLITPVSGSGESFKQTLFYLFIICSINSQRRFFGKCSCVIISKFICLCWKMSTISKQDKVRWIIVFGSELTWCIWANGTFILWNTIHISCILPLMSALPARVKAYIGIVVYPKNGRAPLINYVIADSTVGYWGLNWISNNWPLQYAAYSVQENGQRLPLQMSHLYTAHQSLNGFGFSFNITRLRLLVCKRSAMFACHICVVQITVLLTSVGSHGS